MSYVLAIALQPSLVNVGVVGMLAVSAERLARVVRAGKPR
jgi:hypothetical protein